MTLGWWLIITPIKSAQKMVYFQKKNYWLKNFWTKSGIFHFFVPFQKVDLHETQTKWRSERQPFSAKCSHFFSGNLQTLPPSLSFPTQVFGWPKTYHFCKNFVSWHIYFWNEISHLWNPRVNIGTTLMKMRQTTRYSDDVITLGASQYVCGHGHDTWGPLCGHWTHILL